MTKGNAVSVGGPPRGTRYFNHLNYRALLIQ